MRNLLIVITLFAVAQGAMAQGSKPDSGLYGGGGIGRTNFSDETSEVSSLVASSVAAANPGIAIVASTTPNLSDTSFHGYLGWQLNKNFSIEGGWADLGEVKSTTTTTGVVTSWVLNAKASGPYAAAIGMIPLGSNGSIYGKLGIHNMKLSVGASVTGLGGSLSTGTSATNSGAVLGIGYQYDGTDKIGGRIEFTRYQNIGKSNTTGQIDANILTVGLHVRF